MKKWILILSATLAFASNHGQTNDPDLQLALKGKYQQAFKGFYKRCEKNEGYACGMVGFFIDKGFGVEKNHKKAVEFYKKGCNLNDSDSCTLLGYYAYQNSNKQKAKEYLNKACKLGNQDACNYLNKVK